MNNLLKQYCDTAEKNVAEASSLPFAVYHSSEVYQQEVENIFHNDWVFSCAEAELKNKGDYYAFSLAGESIAIVRTADDKLVCLSNICRHRGTPLLEEGYGNFGKNIVCPYHAWTYSDQGALRAAPMTGTVDIDKSAHCLPQFHVDVFLGLVFIHLGEPLMQLKERFSGLDDICSIYPLDTFADYYHAQAEHWASNWKLAMENGMESYHLFKVHKNTLETVTPTKQAYYVAGSPEWTVTGGKMVDPRASWTKWFETNIPEAYGHYQLLLLPPFFVGVLTYESLDWIQILPDGPEQCIINAGGISHSKSSRKAGADFVKSFFAEDKLICERVQTGMKSIQSQGGKLVEMEKIVCDFHQYLAKRLFKVNCGSYKEENIDLFK